MKSFLSYGNFPSGFEPETSEVAFGALPCNFICIHQKTNWRQGVVKPCAVSRTALYPIELQGHVVAPGGIRTRNLLISSDVVPPAFAKTIDTWRQQNLKVHCSTD